ncbi:carboxymuconolactone decarboxylase family protein [Amycolatopsis sp. NPDC026612]|uniref:carboxymuconolactone decarboxylase family protein n=1 Tax=Amycolatopsis sp. NPDC026612 TaxID=3155466 RepID=UPI00340FECA4
MLDPEEAHPSAGRLLGDIVQRHGDAGEMVRVMAHSPALLQGYLDLSRAVKRIKIPRALAEKISLAVQEWIGCPRCLAAHVDAARAAGLTDADIELARQGTSMDGREAALVTLAVRLLVEPSSIEDADIASIRECGWSDRILGDLVALVALNQLTGSFNLLVGLGVDETQLT